MALYINNRAICRSKGLEYTYKMSGCFEDSIRAYANAILAVHSKYSTKRNHDKAVEITEDIISAVFDAMMKLNPAVIETLNGLDVAPITEEVVASFKGKKAPKKVAKALNVYTSIFIPIVRRVAEPILKQWDDDDPDVFYNRITSINSIASKIYKNLTDKNSYTDHYVYEPDTTQGKTTGVIVASVVDPAGFDEVSNQYADIVKTLAEDKIAIEAEIKKLPDDQIKAKKAELVASFMLRHEAVYNSINDYIVTFMDNYRDALRNMCLDKPLKKAKKTTTKVAKVVEEEEGINMDEEGAQPFELVPVDDLMDEPVEEEIEVPVAPVMPAVPVRQVPQLPVTNAAAKKVAATPAVTAATKKVATRRTTRKN